MDVLIILLNNVMALFMVQMELFLVTAELTIKKAKKNLDKNFNYEQYKVLKSKIEKILKLLNVIEKKLSVINKILSKILKVITVIQGLIIGLTAIPILPTIIHNFLIKLNIYLSSITKILRVVNNIIKIILAKINRIKELLNDFLFSFNDKLKQIIELFNTVNTNKNIDGYNGLVINNPATNTSANTGTIVFNTNINTNIFKDNGFNFTYKQVELILLDLNEYSNTIDDLIKTNQEYKGYIFKIYELDSTIPNIKNRYAVALDDKGVEKFRSETSFTLRPTVLIESLKFKIDNDLIANYII
jgi:hypothetical protein